MTAAKRDLYVEQGATFRLRFRWMQPGTPPAQYGAPYDITGWIARMQFRVKQGSTPLLNATSTGSNPMIVIDGPNGWVTIKITDESTNTLPDKKLKYDLELESPQGDVFRLLEGSVLVSPNITQ